MSKGWVCLHRSLADHWIYEDPDFLKIWVSMLFKANHETKTTLFNGSLVTVERGQFVFGRIKFAAETNISESKIRKALKLLKTDQMISQQNSSKYSIISILNYEDHQNNSQHSNQHLARNQHATSTQPATSKQLNNSTIKQKTQGLNFSGFPENPSDQVWEDFKKVRQARKAPITQTVINQIGKQLTLANQNGYSVDRCLSTAIEANWQTFKYEWLVSREGQSSTQKSSGGLEI